LLLAAAEVALAQGKEQIAGKYLDLIDQHVVAGSWEQEHSWVLRFELARHLEHEQQALAAIKTLQQLAIRSRHRLAGALAVFAAGRLNAISGPSRQARIELETSADLFRGLGAQGWADAAEEELARLDIRDGRWAEAVTGWVNVGYRRLRAGAVRDAARCFAYQIATLAMVNRINSARETTVALDRLAQQENVLFRAAQLFDAGAADLFAAARGTATWLGSWPGVAAAGVSADAIKPATQISQWMANITRSREMKQDNGATGQTRPNGPGVGCWEDRLTVARALATIESGQPLDHSPLMDVHARLRRGGWPFFAGLAALVAAEAYVAGAGRANRENKFWDKGFQTLSAQLGWADKHFRSSGAASLAVRSAKAIKALNSIVLPLAIEGHDDAQRLAVLLRVIGCLRAQTTPDLMLEKVLGEVASYLGACLGMLFLWERHGVNLSVKAKLGHPRLTANHVRQLVNAWAADGLGQFRVRVVRSAEELPPALQADLGTVLPIVFMPVQLGTDAAGAMAFWSFSSPPGNQLLNDNFFAALADQLLLAGNRQLLSRRLREAVRISDLSERCSRLTKPLIGASSAMERVFTMIDKLKDSPSTVLIRGESGTGKELVARALHECGVREKKPFSAFFCGALARDIIEAELFGAARGAFTGAITDRPGLLEAADHGTVFLDEVSDIPLDTQAKLLRVLQEGEIRRVGSAAVRRIDVRFIAASNRPLEEDIEAGRLRKDLYYRLNVVSIELPPLRQRGGDIPLLANHFLAKYNKRLGKDVPGFTNEVEQFLTHYSWPGNVRELENAVEAAVNLAGFGESISWPHLPVRLVQAWRLMQSGKTQSDATVQWQRRELVIRTLSECDWVKIRAADRLGLSRQGLDKLMKRLDIKKF